MATNSKFKPKASNNIIEGVTPVEEKEVVADEVTTLEEVEETTEKVEEVATVTFEEKESKKPAVKNVKICTKVNHSCFIGGVSYHFEKGKQYNVPESVKSILRQADLLMPL